MRTSYSYGSFEPIVISNREQQRPPRNTTPHSVWRNTMESMEPGDWFELPKKFQSRVTNAAASYLKGRYTCYKHGEKEGTYVFSRTK